MHPLASLGVAAEPRAAGVLPRRWCAAAPLVCRRAAV
jgi:hypothetical protein